MMFLKYTYKHFYLLLFLTIMSCGNKEVKEIALVRPVKYTEVTYLGGNKSRTFSGTAKTDKIVNLSFRSTGIITVLDMKLGQQVKKGQLLSKLDNVQARLSYEAAIESKNSAESQMNTAKLNLNRIRTLYEKGSASLSDYEAAKNSYRTATASFESAKRSVAIQQEQIKFGFLYAPEDGVIASVNSEVDENVSPGQTIGVLNAGTAINIELGIPESIINALKKDMKVTVSFPSINNKTFHAIITEISPTVDKNSSTYPVKIMVTDADANIKSGMAANVLFEFSDASSLKKMLVVPANAVGEDGKSRFVFILETIDQKLKVKKQPISIGELTPEGFEVTKGLAAGQKVVTAGLQTILDGQEVKLNEK